MDGLIWLMSRRTAPRVEPRAPLDQFTNDSTARADVLRGLIEKRKTQLMCFAMDALNAYDDSRQQLKTLEEMQAEVRSNNETHGWYDELRLFGDDVALLHTEVSEMYEAFRQWGTEDMTGIESPHSSYVSSDGVTHFDGPAKPEGVGSEMADVLIRLLDTAERSGVDLRAEYERKMAFNRTRPFRHGGKRA
jgi:NTP pyrophosphatase (non-canonical NTP hydrolase)